MYELDDQDLMSADDLEGLYTMTVAEAVEMFGLLSIDEVMETMCVDE